MYSLVLTVHSLLRWVVLLFGLWAIVRAYGGVSSRRAWAPSDDSAGRWFIISMDVQFVIGLVLYGFLSPITMQALADLGGAMRDPVQRFWAVEHITLMIAGLVLAHIGRARARRAVTDAARHRNSALFYTLAVLAVLAAIPWPFLTDGRPLFRLGA
jgi:hypothetical protein